MTDDEIRQAAKEAGIKSWHVKSIETLKTELETLKTDNVTLDELPTPAAAVQEIIGPRVKLIKQFKDGTHYAEWTEAKDVADRLSQGWVKSAVQ